jgi:hypothetical protein
MVTESQKSGRMLRLGATEKAKSMQAHQIHESGYAKV